MKRLTKRFALCLKNRGNEASLILGKVYRIVLDANMDDVSIAKNAREEKLRAIYAEATRTFGNDDNPGTDGAMLNIGLIWEF